MRAFHSAGLRNHQNRLPPVAVMPVTVTVLRLALQSLPALFRHCSSILDRIRRPHAERRVARAASPGCTAWSATSRSEPPLTRLRDLAQLAGPPARPATHDGRAISVHSAPLPTLAEPATDLALPVSPLVPASQPDSVTNSLNTCAIARNTADALAAASTTLRRASLSQAISGELPACPVVCINCTRDSIATVKPTTPSLSYRAPTTTVYASVCIPFCGVPHVSEASASASPCPSSLPTTRPTGLLHHSSCISLAVDTRFSKSPSTSPSYICPLPTTPAPETKDFSSPHSHVTPPRRPCAVLLACRDLEGISTQRDPLGRARATGASMKMSK